MNGIWFIWAAAPLEAQEPFQTVVAASSLRRFQSNPQVQAFLRGVTPAVVGLLVAKIATQPSPGAEEA